MNKSVRYLLLGLVVVLLIIYVAGTIYAKALTTRQVNKMITVIEQNYGNVVQNISYQSIDANFFSLLNDDLAVNGITVTFTQQINNPLNIAQIELTHYHQDQNNIPTQFSVRVKRMQFDSFKHALIGLVNRDQTSAYLGLLPISINPSLNATVDYDGKMKTLEAIYTISNDRQTIINDDIQLNQFTIKQPLNSGVVNTMLTALDDATINMSKTKISYDRKLDQDELMSDHGHVAQMLKDLGYKSTNFSVDGQGSYNSTDHSSQFTLKISLQNGGMLTEHSITTYPAPRTLHNLVNWIKTGQVTDKDVSAQLVSLLLEYQDQSLTNRIIDMVANNSEQNPSDVRNMTVTSLSQSASSQTIPQFQTAIQQLANFVNDPNRITLSIQPAKPYSFAKINSTISNLFNAETQFNQSLSNVDPTQRLALYQQHQAERNAKISQFLTQLGFSVVAKPSH